VINVLLTHARENEDGSTSNPVYLELRKVWILLTKVSKIRNDTKMLRILLKGDCFGCLRRGLLVSLSFERSSEKIIGSNNEAGCYPTPPLWGTLYLSSLDAWGAFESLFSERSEISDVDHMLSSLFFFHFEFFFADWVVGSPTLKILIQESKGRCLESQTQNLEVKKK